MNLGVKFVKEEKILHTSSDLRINELHFSLLRDSPP